MATTGEIIQNDIHSEALVTHKNHLSIAHLNTQSMSLKFEEFRAMFYQHLLILLRCQKPGNEMI